MRELLKSVLPDDTYQRMKEIYKEHITEYRRDIYSEFGEDFVAAVLLGFKKNGTYVDIGAFRPKELSVTYYFYRKLGWSGITIEPNPAAKERFLTQRPKDKFIDQGVGETEDSLTYYEFQDPTLNSFSHEVFENNKDTFISKKEIKVSPLRNILNENLDTNAEIDLMNIDVEGLDKEVLRSHDWDKFPPKVLIIEDHEFDPEEPLKSEIVQFIKSKGYKLKANCLISLVFLKES
ncbi:MAG: SAM-dependent methyltransferase [Halobacteriovoraceae bacterium]|nr:SAM-dependent methyltransferase [Halobacteriovoraceae bacterium]